MVVTDNLDCKTCCKIEADPELERLQAVCDKIADKRDRKNNIRAKVAERFVKEVYLRTVTTAADRKQWHKDCTRWEKWQKKLSNEIESLTNDLEAAERKWARAKYEIEEPDEDDFIDLAFEEYQQIGNQFGKRGHFFYYGRATRKEVMEHPYHFPRCFPPEEMMFGFTREERVPC